MSAPVNASVNIPVNVPMDGHIRKRPAGFPDYAIHGLAAPRKAE
jgi:hypothetical protein